MSQCTSIDWTSGQPVALAERLVSSRKSARQPVALIERLVSSRKSVRQSVALTGRLVSSRKPARQPLQYRTSENAFECRERAGGVLIALLLNSDEDSSLRESDISSLPDLILERA